MNVKHFPSNVIYIEDAIPLHKEFIEALETNNENANINSVIPPWEDWMDGYPVDGEWTARSLTGSVKNIDWDYTINDYNNFWPRKSIEKSYSLTHGEAYAILKMIDEPFQKALDVWAEATNNNKLEWVTKNYTIKKYLTNRVVGRHTDRDHNRDVNTFDWTALIYLNDNYSGGNLNFDDLRYKLSPKAGSIVFFPSDEYHSGEEVFSGTKYFMFFHIQSKYKFCHSFYENFVPMVREINKNN